MNENINLCEILKDCPRGTKLYSPLWGEVEFDEITTDDIYTIKIRYNLDSGKKPISTFTKNGKFLINSKGECLLFPSKEQRDWSKWNCPKLKFDPKTLKPFDKIIYRFDNSGKWRCDFFSHMLTEKTLSVISTYYPIDFCIPYNDDTKHLVGTSDEAPEYYRYWED